MNGITSRCISFDQGNKDCLQRVNYEFGLVLGVDEFVQEQCYFLEKEYQHNRALHGYGTVSGLLVSANENGADIEIQVEKGIGVDQYGRVFVVRNPQCASLLSWIADQELQPGDQTVYVVAKYAECETGLVPIAGQPCSTSEQSMAASRLQDIYEIELVLEPPDHSARNAAVNLSEFLSRFRADLDAADLADLGDPGRLVDIIGPDPVLDDPADYRVRINQVVETITGTPGETIIPVQPLAVEDLLNDIFTYWVTEVRPTLGPDLIDPDAPENADADPPAAEILLARVDFILPDTDPLELDDIAIDNTTRPYLLHTQLIQELYDFPDLAGEGGAAAPARELREWVTIADTSPRILRLWFHIDQDLELIPNDNFQLLRIRPNGTVETINIIGLAEEIPGNNVGRYVRLRSGTNLNNGDFLLLRFNANQIQLGGGGSLADFIASAPFTYPNYQPGPGRLLAFHVVDRSQGGVSEDQVRELILELAPPQEPIIPFVTITPLTDGLTAFAYELWFHLDGAVDLNEGVIENLVSEENFAMFVETEPNAVELIPISRLGRRRENVWEAFPNFDNQPTRSLVRFAFALDVPIGINAFSPTSGGMEFFETLREYIDRTNQRLDGHVIKAEVFGGEALVVYVREQASAGRIEI